MLAHGSAGPAQFFADEIRSTAGRVQPTLPCAPTGSSSASHTICTFAPIIPNSLWHVRASAILRLRARGVAFTVEDFQDLLRLLEQRPEWRAELRRYVLSDDVVELPSLVRGLAEAQARTEQRVAELAQ